MRSPAAPTQAANSIADLEAVRDYLGGLPYMSFNQAKRLHRMLSENNCRDCLELGFYHGVSSAYIAASLRQNGGGHLTTFDQTRSQTRQPNIHQILEDLDLTDWVTAYFGPHSYNWEMMKLIEAGKSFDFCYIDGSHEWNDDGFAFFLVERLLRPGGWVVLDDLDFCFKQTVRPDNHPAYKAYLERMSDEQLKTRQVRLIWDLLVKPHPHFHNFYEDEKWGVAQKKPL